MAVDVDVQYNGGFLLDIILYVDPMLLPSGNQIKCHGEFLCLQPMFPPQHFDNFPPWLEDGCLQSLDAFRCLFKKIEGENRGEIERSFL